MENKQAFTLNANDTITIRYRDAELIFAKESDYLQLDDSSVVIKHGTVMQIADSFNIQVSEPKILIAHGPKSYVVTRTASDQILRKEALGIGEVIPENLETPISKKYPFITADTRAYDRAVLQLLGLSGKVYSDFEISEKSAREQAARRMEQGKTAAQNGVQKAAPGSTPAPQPTVKAPAPVQQRPETTAPVVPQQTPSSTGQPEAAPEVKTTASVRLNHDALEEPLPPTAQETTVQTQKYTPQTTQPAQPPQQPPAPQAAPASAKDSHYWWWNERDIFGPEVDPDVFIVNKGKHRDDHITVSAMADIDMECAEWFAEKEFSPTNQDFNKMVESCRRVVRRKTA